MEKLMIAAFILVPIINLTIFIVINILGSKAIRNNNNRGKKFDVRYLPQDNRTFLFLMDALRNRRRNKEEDEEDKAVKENILFARNEVTRLGYKK